MTQSTEDKIYSLLASARALTTFEIATYLGDPTLAQIKAALKALDSLHREGKVNKKYSSGEWTHWSRPDVGSVVP